MLLIRSVSLEDRSSVILYFHHKKQKNLVASIGFSGGVYIKIKDVIIALCLIETTYEQFARDRFLFRKPNSAASDGPTINETIYTSDNPESVTTVGNWVKSLVKRSFGNRTANNYSPCTRATSTL